MTTKATKEPGDSPEARKPRGMGGVVLILALLMALFLVVSSGRSDGLNSVHAFYSYLLNGKVERSTERPTQVLVQDARAELEALLAKLAAEPGKLELVEERLFALRAAARIWACRVRIRSSRYSPAIRSSAT